MVTIAPEAISLTINHLGVPPTACRATNGGLPHHVTISLLRKTRGEPGKDLLVRVLFALLNKRDGFRPESVGDLVRAQRNAEDVFVIPVFIL